MKTEPVGCYAQVMAIYLYRWPNGEFSVVSAKSKSDAIELLEVLSAYIKQDGMAD